MSLAPALCSATAHAGPTCDDGGASVARYSYCFFETRNVPAEDGYNNTTSAARTSAGAGTAGTDVGIEAAVLEDARETTPSSSTRWAASALAMDVRILYRTTVTTDLGAGQEDADGAAQSAAFGAVMVDDPLLRRTTLGTGYHQDAPAARPCEHGVEARATFLSDSVGFAPGAPCIVPLPWVDAALVTVAVANTLP